jgi:hypothetical protein
VQPFLVTFLGFGNIKEQGGENNCLFFQVFNTTLLILPFFHMGVFQQNSTFKFYSYSSTQLIVVIMASFLVNKKDGVTFDELTSTSLDNYIGSLSSRGNYIDMCYMGRIPLRTHLSIIFLWMLVGSSFLSKPLVVVVTLNFFGVGFVGLCLSFILQIFKP